MMRNFCLPALCAALLAFGGNPLAAQAPGAIGGQVTSGGAALSGAQVVVTEASSGAQFGSLADAQGRYTVPNLRPGRYTVQTQMIGYTSRTEADVLVSAGQTSTVDFELSSEAVSIAGLEVFASRATERKTPVAFTDVDKVQLQNQLGSRDLPLVLNTTPSVYSTQQGGGAGDARINVRGFSQRNTAVMINGVPVNDMENGWVYWSNWDGLGDAATSIQVQRGLSAVNLATPSIGGTMNVITDPTAQRPGIQAKQEFGSDAFLKTTLTGSTGEVGRLAVTGVLSRKTGDGRYLGTYTDAWSYYLASSFQANARNRIEFYVVGAPQTHGQNLYKLNAGTIDQEFARDLEGYDPAALEDFPQAPEIDGQLWSPNIGPVSRSYAEEQYASVGPETGRFQRQLDGYLQERENYFHKPQANLNWYSYFGSGLTLSTVGYYSGGDGGGSGTLGSLVWDYSYTQRFPDWDPTIERNALNDTGSRGILRSSVNSQDTWGVISKLRKDFANGLSTEVGVDWRTATIDHYRDVRDLLGGAYWLDSDDEFSGDRQTTYGDRIDYNDRNNVDWIGGHFQAEKSSRQGSVFAMVGLSQISYSYENFFVRDPNNTSETLKLESGDLSGYQIKGGAVYNLTDEWSTYTNLGYVSKVPIFDGVIDDGAGVINPDPTNETFISFEGGVTFRSLESGISFDLNAYHTNWKDRTRNQFVRNIDGQNNDGLVNLLGLDARHMGVEASAAFQPNSLFRFDAAASLGNWEYTNDVEGTYRPDEGSGEVETFNFYLEGLKVGDAPQTQFALAASVYPAAGASLQLVSKLFGNHYAEYDPFSRTDETDTAQSWQAPGYSVFDLHASYNITNLLPSSRGGDVRLFANVFNLLDQKYVQDAVDNSAFNSYDDDHDADDAEIFLGLPRSFNFGVSVRF
ncbi:TonB-dependent receptor [Gemmatimonadota bacterium Y43]